MPAGSEGGAVGPGPAPLPLRFRPRGVRVASVLFGVVLLVTVVAVWLAMPDRARESFTLLQRSTVLAMGAGTLAVFHALSRCRLDADDDGLTVVNGYRTHRFAWGQVVAVSLRPGSPWAVLDLSDGGTCGVLGIQGSDGPRAQAQVRDLRALLEARAAREPER